jgi:GNAT superfamily N-acetyltransferase
VTTSSPRSSPRDAGASTFRIRPARRGDAEALATLLKELGYPNAADNQTVNWVVSHPEIEVIVAADGADRPVGMLSFSHRPQLRMKGRIGTIDELVVTQAWRGKGVGKALLQKVVERARTLTVKRLELTVHVELGPPPAPFLEKCGFASAGGTVFRYPGFDFMRAPSS